MTIDLDARLADLRQELAQSVDTDLIDRVVGTDPAPHRADRRLTTIRPARRRRVAAVVATAGLAAAACVAVPAVLPAGSPGAADQAAAVQALHRLARIAAVSPTDQLAPNQYLHLVDVEHQAALNGQPGVDSRFEEWIRADGTTWEVRHVTSDATPPENDVWLLPAGPSLIDGMTAAQELDALPTDPGALKAYVLAHSTGSTSADERVFVAVVDIVRRGLAPAALRSAAIEVLAQLGHVRLGDDTRDSMGHPVQEFEFDDPAGRPGDVRAVMFDTATAQVTEEHEYFDGTLFFTRTVASFEVVDSVPSSVRDQAVAQK